MIKAKAGVEKFYQDIMASNNTEDIKRHIDNLLKLTYRYASKKNDRHNKGLKVFEEYLKTDTREQKIKRAVEKERQKTYKDYINKFIALRSKNFSWQKISDYMQERHNIKVSRETIRQAVKDFENDLGGATNV